jgi:hypothetical protein
MNHDSPDHPNESDLLRDVFAETDTPKLRAELLATTLNAVRRQDARRRRNRCLLASACALGLVWVTAKLVLPAKSQPPMISPNPSVAYSDPLIIRSQPLAPGMIVVANPGDLKKVSSFAGITVVVTSPATELFEPLDDDKLMTLVAGKPVAVVHEGPFVARFVFLNPDDAEGWPLQ